MTKETTPDGFMFNGRRVRSWCVDAGISIDELAGRIGASSGALKTWIYGTRNISFTQACAIADVFGKSLDDLIERVASQQDEGTKDEVA